MFRNYVKVFVSTIKTFGRKANYKLTVEFQSDNHNQMTSKEIVDRLCIAFLEMLNCLMLKVLQSADYYLFQELQIGKKCKQKAYQLICIWRSKRNQTKNSNHMRNQTTLIDNL